MSCGTANDDNQNATSSCITPTSQQLNGTWAYCDDGSYVELEISDSLYWYIDEGEYIGPVVPYPYILKGDSLFAVYEDGSKMKDRQYKLCYDGTILEVNGTYLTMRCVKTQPPLRISDWTLAASDKYKKEFQGRADAFTCP